MADTVMKMRIEKTAAGRQTKMHCHRNNVIHRNIEHSFGVYKSSVVRVQAGEYPVFQNCKLTYLLAMMYFLMSFVLRSSKFAFSTVAGALTGYSVFKGLPPFTASAQFSMSTTYSLIASLGVCSSATKYALGRSPTITQRNLSPLCSGCSNSNRKRPTTPPTPHAR